MIKQVCAQGNQWRRVALAAATGLMATLAVAPPALANESGAVVEQAPIKANKVIQIGMAKAGKRIVSVGERGIVLVSDDDGATWKAVRTPTTRTLTTVAFADDRVGVAVGHGGSVLRTEDAGNTWTQIEVADAGRDSLLGLTFLGGQDFAAFGAFGLFIITNDAGKTWRRMQVVDADFDRHIMGLVPMDGVWFLAAESGNLARSKDAGATWEKLKSPYVGSFFGALVAKDGALIAFGMRGNVWRSTDKGSTWTKIEIGNTIGINGGGVMGDGSIVLVGNVGMVATSHDNGNSFKVAMSPRGAGFATVVANSKDEPVVAGEAGVALLDSKLLAK